MTKLRDMRFKRTDLSTAGQMEFDQKMLRLLMAIDGNKTLFQIAKEIKMDAAVFKQYLMKIYNLGLIEEVKEKVEYIDNAFLESIRDALVELLGPLGEILMQDAADMMNTKLSHIPKSSIPEFLKTIKNDIPGQKQREQFQITIEERMLSLG